MKDHRNIVAVVEQIPCFLLLLLYKSIDSLLNISNVYCTHGVAGTYWAGSPEIGGSNHGISSFFLVCFFFLLV